MKRKNVYTLCSYVPSKIINDLGFEVIPLYDFPGSYSHNHVNLPVTLCGYVRFCENVIDKIDFDALIFTNCCNAMQRLYDSIILKYPDRFIFLLELPRNQSDTDKFFFENQIRGLLKSLCEYFNLDADETRFLPKQQDINTGASQIADDSIYVLGSALNPFLRKKIKEYLKDYPVIMNMCFNRGDDYSTDSFFQKNPCARMNNFSQYINDFICEHQNKLSGMIYISSQYCDSFLFAYPIIQKICQNFNIPLLAIEESYLQNRLGQISTRIEAFLECIMFKKSMKSKNTNVLENSFHNINTKAKDVFKQRLRLVHSISNRLPLISIQKVVENQIDFFTNKAWNHPEKIILTNMVMPQEIFYAAGLIPVNMELIAGWLASLNLTKHYIEKSESMGFSPNLCSYHKATIGLIAEEGLPPPRVAAISSHICDGSIGLVHFLNNKYNTKEFIINVPFNNNKSSFDYLCDQYSQLMKFIEDYTGEKIKEEKFLEALSHTNEARKYWIKAFDLRKGEPLFPGFLSLRNLFGATFLFGSDLGYEVAKSYYDQLLDLSTEIDKNYSIGKSKKKRLLWIHFAPLYNNRIMEYLEKELDCWIVMDITGHMYWSEYDLEKPIESISKRTLDHFYLGNPVNRNDMYKKLIKEYEIDGVIHFMHIGCRAIPGSSHQIRGIADGLDVPYLELVGDCIDPRGFSEQQMRLRLEAFKETLWR